MYLLCTSFCEEETYKLQAFRIWQVFASDKNKVQITHF